MTIDNTSHPIQKIWIVTVALRGLIVTPIIGVLLSWFTPITVYDFLVNFWVWGVVAILFIIRAATLPKFTYNFENAQLRVSQGLFTKSVKQIPYNTVQAVSVTSGLSRLLGLADVTVKQASTTGFTFTDFGFTKDLVVIPGLLPAQAEEIKNFVQQKISQGSSALTGQGL